MKQAITGTSGDPDRWRRMASLGHNEFTDILSICIIVVKLFCMCNTECYECRIDPVHHGTADTYARFMNPLTILSIPCKTQEC